MTSSDVSAMPTSVQFSSPFFVPTSIPFADPSLDLFHEYYHLYIHPSKQTLESATTADPSDYDDNDSSIPSPPKIS